MGYAKWRLGHGDCYQTDVARYRVARLLEAHMQGVDGPMELACEAPVEGWDDIVEFGIKAGEITTTHYQVKHQNTDFNARELSDTFGKLFTSAAHILQVPHPYDDLQVPVEGRRFVLVLPTHDINVGTNRGIDQLKTLFEKCKNHQAAKAIVANNGANISDGKSGGEQQRNWLALIKTSAVTDDACVQLLQQMSVEILPREVVIENTQRLLASQFDDPNRATLLLDEALRNNPPEGRLDSEELLAQLADALPNLELRCVRLVQDGNAYCAQLHTRQRDLAVVARNIVENLWREHGAPVLHVGYPPPVDPRLRLACVRLLLHAERSPVFVTGRDNWWERSKAEVAGAVGFHVRQKALHGEHYEEKALPRSLRPMANWAAAQLSAALHAAMDDHVWVCVLAEGKAALVGAGAVPFEEVAASMKGLDGFFERVLRGWWKEEENASGVARAGPAVAHRVAQIVAAVAILQHLGYNVGATDVPLSIARVGDIQLRGLAMEQVGGIYDKLRIAVPLTQHARDILDHAGLVLVQGSVDDLYELADPRQRDELDGAAGILSWTTPAFLMNPDSLITAVKKGDAIARNLVESWCNQRAKHHRAALDAALQQSRESDGT